ncbi:D-alanyl-D-alanine carboxypeptidase/D-alanyl-D-alanine-endopeptidase [Scytonema hofmannii FACHB-248]|uniref:D-alanyl-D-alanine carboxypeptidase/D-alanyl-D-alanine-endopeptidase n=1 Tax=Scytonema hofmannii FACHB-248 TaxID=1842502 RepID=A0ABR8GZ59_9CYAN|nr:D-alanyl-D-alanine carboxypeptidase/D-alanyl-D-alanine-endopeptidase [Scytonema hofmannii FACHB-248]
MKAFNKALGCLLLFLTTQIGFNSRVAQAQIKVAPATKTKNICPNQLAAAVDEVINRPQYSRVRWGILVQPLYKGQNLYSRDAQKYFIPASNAKLLTTAAALQQLGANFRIRTSVYQDGNNVVRVVGRGDPSFSDTQLVALARQLKAKGITQIEKLIADDSYFQGDIVSPSWEWEDVYSDYGAPVNSLIVNQNVFSIKLIPQVVGKPLQVAWTDFSEGRLWQIINQSMTVEEKQPAFINVTRELSGNVLRIQGQLAVKADPLLVQVPVVDPNYYFLRRFRIALAGEKIRLRETVVVSGGLNQQELAFVESPLLSDLVMETNQNSNNLYAEALLRAIASLRDAARTPTPRAIAQPKKPDQTTVNTALEVLKTTLTQLGVNPTGYVLVDGSGLSRHDLISPEALVQVLQAMAKTPAASVYRASLPIAGKSGSLKTRFQNTPAEGIVQAKTGTLTGVVSLSGYVNNSKYEPLVFSIIVNQSEEKAKALREGVDEIVLLLTQLQRC